jgi:drug/metabolite transporter (DMT)-like permease
MTPSPSPAILCAILAGLCWGVGEIFTKSAINTREIGPLGTVMLRAAVTLPLAIAGFLVAYRFMQSETQQWWSVARASSPVGSGGMHVSTWLKIILGSGLLAGFGGVFFFYLGLSLPGGDISVLRPIAFALAPATAVLLGWWFLGEGMTMRKGIAVVLIIAGIMLLAGEGRRTNLGKQTAMADRAASDNVPMVE